MNEVTWHLDSIKYSNIDTEFIKDVIEDYAKLGRMALHTLCIVRIELLIELNSKECHQK